MPQITLAKALKVKNRLTGRLNKTTTSIQTRNSVLKGTERDFDIAELVKTRRQITEALVTLKSAIYRGNLEIQETIYTLAERKGELNFWQSIGTTHGPSLSGYTEEPVEYEAVIRQPEADAKVAQLEAEIDDLQDKMDEYNHRTRIDVPQQVLDLAS